MRVTKRFHTEELELNMTPMIDIVFLLLIFFIVVSEIATQDHVENLVLPVASAAAAEEQVPNRLIISVDTFDQVIIGGRVRTMEGVSEYLLVEKKMRRVVEGRPAPPILIQADRHAQWRVVQEIMARGSQLGFWKFSFSARKEDE